MKISNQKDISDKYLKQAFSWLTRIGASPKFGSCSIADYQMHQMRVLKFLEASKAAGFPVRCKKGMVQSKPSIGKWFDVVSVEKLYSIGNGF